MSWKQFISHLLATTHKIEKVAVLNSDGRPLTVTEGLSVSDLEGQALIKCQSDPAHTITKLHIDNNFYTVFQGNDTTVIGISPGRDRVFVAHRSDDHVVVAFGQTTGHGSFLFELKKNLWRKRQDQLQSDHQIRRGQQEIFGDLDKPTLLDDIMLSADYNRDEQEQRSLQEQQAING